MKFLRNEICLSSNEILPAPSLRADRRGNLAKKVVDYFINDYIVQTNPDEYYIFKYLGTKEFITLYYLLRKEFIYFSWIFYRFLKCLFIKKGESQYIIVSSDV